MRGDARTANYTTSTSYTTTARILVGLGTGTGTFNMSGSAGTLTFGGDDFGAGWGGRAADPYYVAAAEDIVYGNTMNLAFTGLDDEMDYNVRIYSCIGDNGAIVDGFSVTDGAGSRVVTKTRGQRWSASSLLSCLSDTLR